MTVECPTHGEVQFTPTGDFINDSLPVTMHCPMCEGETQKIIIKDDRTPEEKQATIGFMVATDDFMSGWGDAPRRSIVARPVKDDNDLKRVKLRFNLRPEFKRVKFVKGKATPAGLMYKPRLHPGDHLHIYSLNSFTYSLED